MDKKAKGNVASLVMEWVIILVLLGSLIPLARAGITAIQENGSVAEIGAYGLILLLIAFGVVFAIGKELGLVKGPKGV
jgi:hypothetical protein